MLLSPLSAVSLRCAFATFRFNFLHFFGDKLTCSLPIKIENFFRYVIRMGNRTGRVKLRINITLVSRSWQLVAFFKSLEHNHHAIRGRKSAFERRLSSVFGVK